MWNTTSNTKREKMINSLYENMYENEEAYKAHLDVLAEVKYQDSICQDFGKKLTTQDLKELLSCRNAIHVCNSTRKYKIAC